MGKGQIRRSAKAGAATTQRGKMRSGATNATGVGALRAASATNSHSRSWASTVLHSYCPKIRNWKRIHLTKKSRMPLTNQKDQIRRSAKAGAATTQRLKMRNGATNATGAGALRAASATNSHSRSWASKVRLVHPNLKHQHHQHQLQRR